MKRTNTLVFAAAALLPALACGKARERPADHVFLNGGVYTVNSELPVLKCCLHRTQEWSTISENFYSSPATDYAP